MMSRLIAQLDALYEEAATEERCDRGGGEHGAAQAERAADLAKHMLREWQQHLQSVS